MPSVVHVICSLKTGRTTGEILCGVASIHQSARQFLQPRKKKKRHLCYVELTASLLHKLRMKVSDLLGLWCGVVAVNISIPFYKT